MDCKLDWPYFFLDARSAFLVQRGAKEAKKHDVSTAEVYKSSERKFQMNLYEQLASHSADGCWLTWSCLVWSCSNSGSCMEWTSNPRSFLCRSKVYLRSCLVIDDASWDKLQVLVLDEMLSVKKQLSSPAILKLTRATDMVNRDSCATLLLQMIPCVQLWRRHPQACWLLISCSKGNSSNTEHKTQCLRPLASNNSWPHSTSPWIEHTEMKTVNTLK